jgi:hypothetical protein
VCPSRFIEDGRRFVGIGARLLGITVERRDDGPNGDGEAAQGRPSKTAACTS